MPPDFPGTVPTGARRRKTNARASFFRERSSAAVIVDQKAPEHELKLLPWSGPSRSGLIDAR
jgi:hypothetical protein